MVNGLLSQLFGRCAWLDVQAIEMPSSGSGSLQADHQLDDETIRLRYETQIAGTARGDPLDDGQAQPTASRFASAPEALGPALDDFRRHGRTMTLHAEAYPAFIQVGEREGKGRPVRVI